MSEQTVTDFGDYIECPHCGAVDEDMTCYPRSLEHDGDVALHDCYECEAEFEVVLCVEYTFMGRAIAKPSEASND